MRWWFEERRKLRGTQATTDNRDLRKIQAGSRGGRQESSKAPHHRARGSDLAAKPGGWRLLAKSHPNVNILHSPAPEGLGVIGHASGQADTSGSGGNCRILATLEQILITLCTIR